MDYICADIGYDGEHVSYFRGLCPVCNKRGLIRGELGYIGFRCWHLNKKCLGKWEVDGDMEYLTYKTTYPIEQLPKLKRA